MKNNYKSKWWLFLSALFVVTSFGLNAQQQFPVVITAGTMGNTNGGSGSATDMDPVDVFSQSFRYQTVFTAAELNAAGVFGGKITSFGWFVTQLPSSALNGYTIKMGHTTAVDAATYNADPTTVVKNPFTWLPATATAYNDIVLDAPFTWNGTSNLLIEVCTNGNTSAAPFGGMRGKTGVANSSNFVGGATDQCAVATTTVGSVRPYIRLTIENPATPPTPVQDPTPPTCLTGSSLTVPGAAPAGEVWYWQTTATGTSTATPVSGAYAITGNGTYYVRSRSVNNVWSTASSIVVNNFPLPTAPPTPTQVTTPACVTTGTDITVPASGDPNVAYYWQGTTANGTSTATPATAPYHVATSGTYHVSAFNSVNGCWSASTPLAVTINTFIPAAPTATQTSYSVCAGATTLPITATTPSGGTLNFASGNVNILFPDNTPAGITHTLNVTGIPAGATITDVKVTVNVNHAWDSDVDMFLTGANGTQIELSTDNGGSGDNYVNTVFSTSGATNVTSGTAPFTGTFQPEGSLPSLYSVGNGNWVIKVADDEGGIDGTLVNWTLQITYTIPVTTISWHNAGTAGAQIGTGSPFETVGTSVLANPATAGTYHFFAQANSNGCVSTSRLDITVNVNAVLAQLNAVDATCNALDNGTFTLGTVSCGNQPFTYSVDGGAFGPIPNDLLAGTYSIVIKDNVGGLSAPVSITINEPTAPTNLDADATYYQASLSWDAEGNEADWVVIWGEAGFDPETEGTTIDPATNPQDINGLDPSTSYDFYVRAGCADESDWAGPYTFSTDAPFTVFDNECGPGFQDISATGTLIDFGAADPTEIFLDDSEAGVTIPFTWNYQGIPVTNISIGANGGIALNTLTGEVGYNLVPSPGLSVYTEDMDEGNVYYETVGIAPNRMFIVQWDDIPDYLGLDGATFQVILQENSEEFYFIYDDVVMDEFEAYGENAEIGITGPLSNLQVSMNDTEYLTNNSCIRFKSVLCPNPTNLDIDPSEEEADVTWDAGGYGETEWTVIYGPAGFDPATEGTTVTPNPTTPSVTLFPLDQNTEYDVYIYSECALDGLTSDGLMGSFTTVPYCSNPTALGATTDVDSLEATWNWTASTNFPEYAIEGFNIEYGWTGFELGTGVAHTAAGTNNADTVFNASYFMGGGVYQYYVQAVCTDDTMSGWAGPFTFVMPLSNDLACGAETLVVDGMEYTFNNTGATVTTGEAAIAPDATGAQETDGWANNTVNGTVWFKFIAPASGSMRVNATGNNYNGQVAVYDVNTCGNFSTFEFVGANDNAIGSSSLAPNFTICGLTPGSEYYLMFDAFDATQGVYKMKLTSINLEAGTQNTGTNAIVNVCSGSNVDLFTTITGEQPGGVWSSSIPSVNISITGSSLETEGLAYTTFNLQYRVTDGCAYDSVIGQVRIFAPSSAGEDGTITACRNEPINLLTGLGGSVDMGGQWYTPGGTLTPNNGGSEVTTANTQGNYNFKYIVNNGVCPNDTALVVVNVLGTCNHVDIEEAMFSSVEVFPNPSAGLVFVTSDINFSYEVTDANGRLITKADNGVKASQKTEIDLSKVEPGVYFIRLKNDDAQKTFRIVIN